jgi:hypothetical protein
LCPASASLIWYQCCSGLAGFVFLGFSCAVPPGKDPGIFESLAGSAGNGFPDHPVSNRPGLRWPDRPGAWQGRQKLFYLPAAHTDFIFSIIAEELDFRACAVILLFIFLTWQMGRIIRQVNDPFGKLIGVGVMTLITFSAVVNIGVSIGALPTKGLPLPFISFGGSSLVFYMVAVGLLLNVSKSEEVAL